MLKKKNNCLVAPNPQAKLVLPLQAVLNLTDVHIEKLENHQQHLDEDMGVTRPPPAQQAALFSEQLP